jgi:hypothetical protein
MSLKHGPSPKTQEPPFAVKPVLLLRRLGGADGGVGKWHGASLLSSFLTPILTPKTVGCLSVKMDVDRANYKNIYYKFTVLR